MVGESIYKKALVIIAPKAKEWGDLTLKELIEYFVPYEGLGASKDCPKDITHTLMGGKPTTCDEFGIIHDFLHEILPRNMDDIPDTNQTFRDFLKIKGE